MMTKTGIGKDFKAEIKMDSYSQRSLSYQRSTLFMGRLLEETFLRTAEVSKKVLSTKNGIQQDRCLTFDCIVSILIENRMK